MSSSFSSGQSVIPLLAESVVQVDDRGLEWKATLRHGIVFHDGTPLTSRDVVHTFESVLDPEIGSRYRATYTEPAGPLATPT